MSKVALKVKNATRGVYLADRAERATSLWKRGVGLMGKAQLPDGYGLVIDPCGTIHMFFMRIPIDVCHIDKEHRVVRILHSIKPWRVGPIVWKSKYVVELPAGTARRTGTEIGDQVVVEREDYIW